MRFFTFLFIIFLYSLTVNAQQISASHAGLGLDLNVVVDLETDIATISIQGPEANWFAYGFGGNAMDGTYAIIVEENDGTILSERKLGNHMEGLELTSSFLTEDVSVTDGVKTVVVTVPADAVGDYYDFPASVETISFIAATGFGGDLSFHGGDNYAQGLQNTVSGLAFSSVVPVAWADFRLSDINGNANVKWETYSEENNRGFYVQRSLDAELWVSLDFIIGENTDGAEYEYIDSETLPGVNYYRIKQVDLDGHVNFSGVKSIEIRGDHQPGTITLFPNPVQEFLSLQMDEISGVKRIQILDMNYRIIVDEIWSAELITHKLIVSTLTAGHYIVSVKHKNWAYTSHFIKL